MAEDRVRSATGPKPGRPAQTLSKAASDVLAALPPGSRKPGGRHRAGQRSGDRVIPKPTIDVLPDMVLTVFQRRWHGKLPAPAPWRVRALAVIAVAMSLPSGTTTEALCQLRPHEVLALRMPRPAWRWVVKWLELRRRALGDSSDLQPWLAWFGSRGMPRQVSYAATRTLSRAGLPGWRMGKLLRSSWSAHQRAERLPQAAGRSLGGVARTPGPCGSGAC
jgi:hypothetical protein